MKNDIASVSVTLGDPVVVAQGPVELDRAGGAWGRWQFPFISRLHDGRLQVRFSIEPDSVESYGLPVANVYSSDNGRNWRMGEPRTGSEVEEGVLLANGDRLKSVQLESKKAGDFDLPTSVCNFVCSYGYPNSLYRVEDLPKELVEWRFSRLPAGTHRWIEEIAAVHIPGGLRGVLAEKARGAQPGIGSIDQVREGALALPFLYGKMRVAPDHSLWAVTYEWRLFDGTPRYAPIFLRSMDEGHTWNMVSAIRYQGDVQADPPAEKRDGFTEPDYNFRPDGSIICLMRTMDGHGHGPLFLTRSADQGRTWSRPVVFDSFGKMPQLLTLDNGVTLATYGASGGPGYFVVRATCDPSGLVWGNPIRTPVSPPEPGAWDTCGHTEMVALDDHRAVMVYSDFNFPDASNIKRKTILVREIKVAIAGEGMTK
jgi:hypothetical protein